MELKKEVNFFYIAIDNEFIIKILCHLNLVQILLLKAATLNVSQILCLGCLLLKLSVENNLS